MSGSIITPQNYVTYLKGQGKISDTESVPKTLMVVFSDSFLTEVLKICPVEKGRGFLSQLRRSQSRPKDFGLLLSSGIGGASIGFLIEILIELGVERVISVGTAGSLSQELEVGTVVLPSGFYGEDGVSRQYGFGAEKECFFSGWEGFRQYLVDQRGEFEVGPVWTTGAPFMETQQKVREYQEKGVLAVDMETASIAAIANYRGIDYESVLLISDSVGKMTWEPWFHHPKFKAAQKKMIQQIIEYCLP